MTQKRTKSLTIKLTPAEWEKIEAAAERLWDGNTRKLLKWGVIVRELALKAADSILKKNPK